MRTKVSCVGVAIVWRGTMPVCVAASISELLECPPATGDLAEEIFTGLGMGSGFTALSRIQAGF